MRQALRILIIDVVTATLIMNLPVCYGGWQEETRSGDPLAVTVVEGDGAVNNIRAQRAHDPVVRVTDEVGRPVRGASVTFTLPPSGPGASFLDGARSATVMTDEDGKAAATGLRPNKTSGPFEIRVLASSEGQTGRGVVHMSNADPNGAPKSKRKLIVLTALAGAAVGGVLAATSRGSSSSNPTTPSQGVIVPGAPTVGAPR